MKTLCWSCGKEIEPTEIYGDWYYCSNCNANLGFIEESLTIEKEKDENV